MVMLAKGNRSQGGDRRLRRATAASTWARSADRPPRLAQDCIRKVEVLEYPELGMEAVWRIEVENFPAFIVVDDKGNDFFGDCPRPSRCADAIAFAVRDRRPRWRSSEQGRNDRIEHQHTGVGGPEPPRSPRPG